MKTIRLSTETNIKENKRIYYMSSISEKDYSKLVIDREDIMVEIGFVSSDMVTAIGKTADDFAYKEDVLKESMGYFHCSIQEDGIDKVNSNRAKEYRLYHIDEKRQDNIRPYVTVCRNNIVKSFKSALKLMNEKYYVIWHEHKNGN